MTYISHTNNFVNHCTCNYPLIYLHKIKYKGLSYDIMTYLLIILFAVCVLTYCLLYVVLIEACYGQRFCCNIIVSYTSDNTIRILISYCFHHQ